MKKDDTVGSICLSLKDIAKNCAKEGGKVMWLNIYGAPENVSNSTVQQEMNNNPELASVWKGRILVRIEMRDERQP